MKCLLICFRAIKLFSVVFGKWDTEKLKASQSALTGEVKRRLELISFTVCSLSFPFRLRPNTTVKRKIASASVLFELAIHLLN
jgi:hypothetical protein